ncbi:MAG: hypothetical protein AAGA56_03025 [Myxococcota bacterium]
MRSTLRATALALVGCTTPPSAPLGSASAVVAPHNSGATPVGSRPSPRRPRAVQVERGAITCGRFDDGTVQCTGHQGSSLPVSMVVAVGGERACGIGAMGDVVCLEEGIATRVAGITQAEVVAVGGDHACAIVSGGELVCWGSNHDGQVGGGHTAEVIGPVSVLSGVVDVDAGFAHTCAVRADGSVWCWGYGHYGQVGPAVRAAASRPTPVRGLRDVVRVELGTYHSCAITDDRQVWCWGYGMGGEDLINPRYREPEHVSALNRARVLSAGMGSTCGVVGEENRC